MIMMGESIRQIWVDRQTVESVVFISAKNRNLIQKEPCCEKTNNVVSEQVRHKPSCTSREDGRRLEILDLESRGIVLSV